MSPTEAKLARLWESILGVSTIGPQGNFFDLGGHSLLAVRMVAEVEREFGKKIPLAVLFENQTVAQLARLLQRQDEEVPPSRWPVLVPIQPRGTRRPLFCVSTFNVNALGYVALARNLGQDQPVYGLQSRYRTETDSPYQRHEFEKLAREYITAMRQVAPHGPYYLCGMCEGAQIAFEMVRFLHEEGETVALLGILDAWPIENTRRYYLYQVDAYRLRLKSRWKSLLKAGSARERAAFLGEQVRKGVSTLAGRVTGAIARPEILPATAQQRLSIDAEFKRRYWPGPDFVPPTVPCKIYLFRIPEQPYWRIDDPACGWASRTTVGVEIHSIPGDHETILREPHVRVLAEKLNACLLRTGVSRDSGERASAP